MNKYLLAALLLALAGCAEPDVRQPAAAQGAAAQPAAPDGLPGWMPPQEPLG